MSNDINTIVRDGVCIGCGLCAAVSDGAVRMAFTPEMRERPVCITQLSETMLDNIRSACPGLVVESLNEDEAGLGAHDDQMWGRWRNATIAWAAIPEVRHRSSSGGVLSALSAYLLQTNQIDFLLHVGPDPDMPVRSRWKISRTPSEAMDTGGSRYGPAAPLAGLAEAKGLIGNGARRFAFIGKPCDISAIRLLAKTEKWLANSLVMRLTLMCGGVSEFKKTTDLLDGWGIREEEIVEFRYRGFGNPGLTLARAADGREFSTTYQALWEDESAWALQHRCKICPDAIGMAADLVAFDCWPGGGPTGEDDGFNAVMTRTPAGETLLSHAVADGALVLGRSINETDFEEFQPHQSRKRRAVWARLAGQRAAGKLVPEARGLGIEALARQNDWRSNLAEARGTARRLNEGRGVEPIPRTQEE